MKTTTAKPKAIKAEPAPTPIIYRVWNPIERRWVWGDPEDEGVVVLYWSHSLGCYVTIPED